jgi:hypothetical protein
MRLLVFQLLGLLSLAKAFSTETRLRRHNRARLGAVVSASEKYSDSVPVYHQTESSSSSSSTTEEKPSVTEKNDAKDADTTTTANTTTSTLPPMIQQMADEQRQYQMNVGKAMDVLRKDMQNILIRQPGKFNYIYVCRKKNKKKNGRSQSSGCQAGAYCKYYTHPLVLYTLPTTDYSIYTKDVTLVDPSGVQLTGLDKYKSAVSFFQTFIKFWFRTETTGNIQFRMVYDFARASIRISWNVVLVPKVSTLFVKPMYVDGISYYQLDRSSGQIQEHKIEKLMINNKPVVPPFTIWSLIQQDALRGLSTSPRGIPVGVSGSFQ